MCIRGSTFSEQNHSSVGHFLGQHYMSDLQSLLQEFFKRQKHLIVKHHTLIAEENSEMRTVMQNLRKIKRRKLYWKQQVY